MNNQNPWIVPGLFQNMGGFGPLSGMANAANLQHMSATSIYRMLNAMSNTSEPKLARARRIAAEVRARRPEMQVRRLTPIAP